MISDIEMLERAYTYWRITGIAIDVDGIQRQQQANGYQPCFGRGDCLGRCECTDCRWRDMCFKLMQTPQVGETLWMSLQTDGV
jgi:hypothetical protein